MMKDKKGLTGLINVVLVLGIIAAVSIFSFLFVKSIFTEELNPILEEEALKVIAANGNDTNLYNTVVAQNQNMKAFDIKIDLIFLALWVGSSLAIFVGAYLLPPISTYSLFTIVFIGLFIVGIFINFIEQIFIWFVTEFITNIFSASDVNLPIFTFYLDNYFLIAVCTIILVIFINQFSRAVAGQETVIRENTTFQSEVEE